MSKAHGLHKKPSKRVPCRRRYKIEKRVREHHRRMRKIAKKDGLKKKGNKKKLQSMPRSCPFSLEDWHGLTYLSPKEAAKLKRAQEREQEQETTVVSTLAPEFNVATAPLATESTSSQVSTAISQRLKTIRGSKATKEKNALVEQDLSSGLRTKAKRARKARKSTAASVPAETEEQEEMQITPEEETYDFETDFN